MDTLFLSNYPDDAPLSWSEECQGITHDDQHWYISQKHRIVKIPIHKDVTHDSAVVAMVNIPAELELIGCDHFGDLDYYLGKLFAPLEGAFEKYVVVFDAADLSVLGWSTLDHQSGTEGHASWCAINPDDGTLNSSQFDASEIFRYEILATVEEGQSKFQFNFLNSAVLKNEAGQAIEVKSVQGGVFSKVSGGLYLSSSHGSFLSLGSNGVHVFNARNGHRIATIDISFDGTLAGREVEGLTLIDLDAINAPSMNGQLHVVVLNNDLVDKDNVSIAHFRVLEEKPQSPTTTHNTISCLSLKNKIEGLNRRLANTDDINEAKVLRTRKSKLVTQMVKLGCPSFDFEEI